MSDDIIRQIDKGLERYYKLVNVNYTENQFVDFCEENGFYNEDIEEELKADAEDCMLVDFDEDFPFPKNKHPTSDEDRQQAVFDIIMRCYKYPDAIIKKEEVIKKEHFNFDEKEMDIITQKYEKYCHAIFLKACTGGDTSISFLKILCVSDKIDQPYLRLLADLYARDRIMYDMHNIEQENKEKEEKDNMNTLTISKWALLNKHMLKIKTFSNDKHEFNMIISALNSYYKYICPLMDVKPMVKINDNYTLQFKQFKAYFDQPVSATPSKKSAQEFSRGTGIILALRAGTKHFDDASKIPKYLNVSSFSDLPNEDGGLFYGSFVKFVIHNIIEADTSTSHSRELSMLNTLQSMLHNKKMKWTKNVTSDIIAAIKNEYTFRTKYIKQLFDYFCKSQDKLTIREYQTIPNELRKLLFGNESQDDEKNEENNVMKLSLINLVKLFPQLTKLSLTELRLSKMEKNARVYVDFVLDFIQNSTSIIGMNLQKVQMKSIVDARSSKRSAMLGDIATKASSTFEAIGWNISYELADDTHNLIFVKKEYQEPYEIVSPKTITEKKQVKNLEFEQMPDYFMQIIS
eukprot:472861_1